MILRFTFFSLLILYTAQVRADFAVDSSSNIDENFSHWAQCYNSTSPECGNCHQHSDTRGTEAVENEVRRACIPGASDRRYIFSERLSSDQMNERDQLICECLTTSPNAFEREPFRSGDSSEETITRLKAEADRLLRLDYRDELLSRLNTERLQSSFAAMSYINNSSEATDLAAKYAFVGNDTGSNSVSPSMTSAGGLAAAFGAGAVNLLTSYNHAINSRKVDDKDFNSDPLPAGFCIPYRHFVSYKQFPDREAFYTDLSNFSSGLVEKDWDYREIMSELRKEIGNGDFEQVNGNGKIAQLYERARFLHNNPIFRNIFNSNNKQVKDDLFALIRRMPKPVCSSGECVRGPNWAQEMEEYRRSMAGFLNTSAAIDANRVGSEVSSRLAYEVTGDMARDTSETSHKLLSRQISDPSAWAGFCKLKSRSTDSDDKLAFIRKVEQNDFGQRDFDNIAEDAEFEGMNMFTCNTPRRNPLTNKTENFFDYFRRECPTTSTDSRCSIGNRGNLVGEFLSSYSDALGNGDESEVQLMLPFLSGQASGPQSIAKSDVENFNRVNRDPVLSRRPVEFRSEEYAGLTAPTRSSAITPVSGPSRTPASTPQSSLSSSQQFAGAQVDQIFAPSQPGSSAIQPASSTPEAIRSSIAQNESESREIREQISSLRDEMSKDPASGGPRDSQALVTLNERLASLERRLSAKESENSDLRDQLAEAEANSGNTPQRTDSNTDSADARRVSSVTSQQNNSPVPQGGVSGGGSTLSPAASGGQASLARNSAGGSVISRGGRSGIDSALLAKYEGSSNGQTGIVVSSGADSVESLRSQSENSIIGIEVSDEVFDQIAGNNQEALNRYFERVVTTPGEVVRLNLTTGSDRSMELFVVKKGGEFSIVNGQVPGRGIASESAPEGIVEPSRGSKLEDLRNELPGR